MSSETVTIFHNPRCGTSRTVLALLKEAGREPAVREYLREPLSRDELSRLAAKMKDARTLLRTKEPLCRELGLDAKETTEAQILDAIARNPVLLNRPVVETDWTALVCRPADTVRDLL
ncbi:arsenate reductase (glutaredoxin) [Acetobacter sp. AN02]|uniref:arsenate reductase (glutaredoxin) n=1 Tax=Acetobacter sp. AN02 TaxID=2894186 RepID=UPI00243461A8|nr:arsenate reductase (glutaredoxin) [Acetobacter sp. AN02]MDG6094486.1 arsenate reductase (glutaredoxin) [Acetobacter sp. AN02]